MIAVVFGLFSILSLLKGKIHKIETAPVLFLIATYIILVLLVYSSLARSISYTKATNLAMSRIHIQKVEKSQNQPTNFGSWWERFYDEALNDTPRIPRYIIKIRIRIRNYTSLLGVLGTIFSILLLLAVLFL